MPNKYNIQAHRQELDRLVRERAWNKVQTLFASLTEETRRLVVECHHRRTHRSLLHYICDLETNHPPADVVSLIATSCPRAMFTPDSKARLPIHLAIRQEAGIDTIKALIESIPKNDTQFSKEKMILHIDSSASTPLLLAAKMGAENREETIKYLVSQDASGQSLLTPTNNARKKKHKMVAPLKYVATREALFVDDGLDSPDDLLRFMIVKTYLARMKVLMREVYNLQNYSFESESEVCILQAAIICHELFGSVKLASSILSAIIRNGMCQPHHRDCLGNSVLHIACLSDTNKFDQVLKLGQRETDYGINSEDCTLMEHLIRINASSFTNFVSRNNLGDIPLRCAIRTGKDILHIEQLLVAHEQSAGVCNQRGELPIHLAMKYGATQDVIMMLWKVYKEAALIPDKSTGMYPFQLAAASSKKTERQGQRAGTAEELDQLSLSYFFLRERPEIIGFFL